MSQRFLYAIHVLSTNAAKRQTENPYKFKSPRWNFCGKMSTIEKKIAEKLTVSTTAGNTTRPFERKEKVLTRLKGLIIHPQVRKIAIPTSAVVGSSHGWIGCVVELLLNCFPTFTFHLARSHSSKGSRVCCSDG